MKTETLMKPINETSKQNFLMIKIFKNHISEFTQDFRSENN